MHFIRTASRKNITSKGAAAQQVPREEKRVTAILYSIEC